MAKYQVAIVKIRRNKKQTWKTVPNLVMFLETETLADIAIKLDECERLENDEDAIYKAFFAIN
jgi:hypothetical protein